MGIKKNKLMYSTFSSKKKKNPLGSSTTSSINKIKLIPKEYFTKQQQNPYSSQAHMGCSARQATFGVRNVPSQLQTNRTHAMSALRPQHN